MKNRNIILFVNHSNNTFSLSTRVKEKSRLENLVDTHTEAGYEVSFLAENLAEYQAKAGVAVFRAAFESACGYKYQSLRTVTPA